MADQVHTGGCLCGGVRYQVVGRLRPVVDCHCGQCRRTHGHVAAYTAAAKAALDLVEDAGLRWFNSSPGVRRGFCATCGASVFWERTDGPDTSIAAGTLDGPTGLATIGHVHVADAGDYYVIADNLPRFAGSDEGALDSNVTRGVSRARGERGPSRPSAAFADASHPGNPVQAEVGMDELSPAPFVDALLGYQQTAALRAAVQLDLFSLVCAGTDTAEAIAAACGAAPRGIRILADYLAVRGFLAKDGRRYQPTPSTRAFLDRASPTCFGSVVDFLAAPEFMALFTDDPVSFVRNGGAPGLANTAPDNPIWVTFARAMMPFMATQADLVAKHAAAWPARPRRVLDVAAGHGLFGIAVATALPGAEVTAVDWPAVLDVARANAERAGLAGRWRPCPGSAFDVDWGAGYDLALLPNFLHHFDPAACVAVLRRVRASLAPGGRTLAVEFVPDADRVSPPLPAMFAFVMLATTPKGDAYTGDEYAAMAWDAGYSGVALTPLAPTPHSMVEFVAAT